MLGVMVPLAAGIAKAGAAECWRGWGYWIDARTRAYKSEELLLVSRAGVDWAPSRPVVLFVLDRASGRIAADVGPITVIPLDPRVYYRGTTNYVDAVAEVAGSPDRMVFGLSHVAPPSAPLARLEAFTAWACGRGEEARAP
ncbi:MAG: hypothetical protein D6826_09070 [Alphaproteobacteria bacterium]|nr:MAG: hypothetical protein D6826_09070 [Alphaproteobacteria bacterium]